MLQFMMIKNLINGVLIFPCFSCILKVAEVGSSMFVFVFSFGNVCCFLLKFIFYSS